MSNPFGDAYRVHCPYYENAYGAMCQFIGLHAECRPIYEIDVINTDAWTTYSVSELRQTDMRLLLSIIEEFSILGTNREPVHHLLGTGRE